jgi:hypothetical protein
LSSNFGRKPVAIAALVASSLGSALVAGGAAHATSWGGVGANPLTVTAGGVINVVNGGKIGLPAGAHDVSWAGQSGRFAADDRQRRLRSRLGVFAGAGKPGARKTRCRLAPERDPAP